MSWLRSSERRSARSAARRSESARSPRAALIQHEGHERDRCSASANTDTAASKPNVPRRSIVQRERAGQQRHDDRGRQQASRHAAADALARQQTRRCPRRVRSVSAPADSSRNSRPVCTAMFVKANSGSPPNTKRDKPSQPSSSAAIASAWCSNGGARLLREQQRQSEQSDAGRGGRRHARRRRAVDDRPVSGASESCSI